MEFIVKKTNELTPEERHGINELFSRVFNKARSDREFLNQSIQNPLGYSYHSMMMDGARIVGINTFVPGYYIANGRKMLFANSTDSMVDKPYRDFFNFSDLVTIGFSRMKKDGVAFVYGYPNDNSFPVVIKGRLYKSIGKMYTYCLPVNIGGIKPSLTWLNCMSRLFCRMYVSICGLFAGSSHETFLYEKESETFNATRYKRSDGKYERVVLPGFELIYKIQVQENVRTAFIIDITVKSPRNFNRAVKYILKHNSKEFDLILYPGYLKFKNASLIRLPRKFEPKNFNFTGRALDKKAFDDSIWNIGNWDTNLSNYDLI